MKEEYPRMLYKVRATQKEAEGFVQENENIGYKTVRSYNEEKIATASGWVTQFQESKKLAERAQNNKVRIEFYKKHLKFIITTSLAIVGLVIAYLSLIKN